MEAVKCALCGSAESEMLAKRARFNIEANTVICTNCGLVFLNPRMSQDEYKKFYSSSSYRKLYSRAERPTKELDERSLRGAGEKFGFLAKNIDLGKFKTKKFIDIGCSAGYLPFVFRRNGWEAEGLEPTRSFAGHGRKKFGISIRTGLLETEKFGKKYSFITLVHVFEHVTEPHAALRKLRSMLADDGILYIEVPNVHEFYGKFEQSCDIAHPYFYSPVTLTSILRANGFDIMKILEGSAVRVFAQKGKKASAKSNEYQLTKSIIKRRQRDYYLKGYFIFTPLYASASEFLANHSILAAAFKKIAKVYTRSRLPFSKALKQLGAVE